jgi:hypothetical protein
MKKKRKNWFKFLSVKWVPTGSLIKIAYCGDNGEYIINLQEEEWDLV